MFRLPFRLVGNSGCFLIIGLLCSCSSQEEAGEVDHLRYYDFQAEINRLSELNPVIFKTVTKDGLTESFSGTVNWKSELALFLEADISKPEFRDSFTEKVTKTDGGEQIIYSAIDSLLPLQEVRLAFTEGQCTKVFIRKVSRNALHSLVQELTYEPGIGYRVESKQKVALTFSATFSVVGRFKSANQILWRAVLDLGEDELPFTFAWDSDHPDAGFEIINGNERIPVSDVTVKSDSLIIKMPVFDSEIKSVLVDNSSISGYWYNYAKGPGYAIPFTASRDTARFKVNSSASIPDIDGKWQVIFSPNTADEYPAVGVFEQNGSNVTGTFLTETGDYRYLQGIATDNQLMLSCFDGAHAFLFKATINGQGELKGEFLSGTHWKEPWTAVRNEQASLTNPDSLTFLKPGYDKLTFSFPDLDSTVVSLDNPEYSDKVIIVQIMGSWCPNCKDETAFLAGFYDQFKSRGLEVIALAYEKAPTFQKAVQNVSRHREYFGAKYKFLIAGDADKKKAAATLPMLNHVLSFPTTIFIDRSGTIRRIYTGFYGPGTGKHYGDFVSRATSLVETMLAE